MCVCVCVLMYDTCSLFDLPPDHVHDTVGNITEAVQCQANPCYTPMEQTAGTKVAMQDNPAYITINDSTMERL